MDEFTTARLKKSPDYDVEVHITGVRIGTTGRDKWSIIYPPEWQDDEELLAEILDRAAEVLRQRN